MDGREVWPSHDHGLDYEQTPFCSKICKRVRYVSILSSEAARVARARVRAKGRDCSGFIQHFGRPVTVWQLASLTPIFLCSYVFLWTLFFNGLNFECSEVTRLYYRLCTKCATEVRKAGLKADTSSGINLAHQICKSQHFGVEINENLYSLEFFFSFFLRIYQTSHYF